MYTSINAKPDDLRFHVSKNEISSKRTGVVSISVSCKLGAASMAIASADRMSRRSWTISRVFVPHPFRSQGVGQKLVERLQKELRCVSQFKKLLISPGGYGSDPKRLINFYTKCGFIKREDEDVYVWSGRKSRTDIATGDCAGAESAEES